MEVHGISKASITTKSGLRIEAERPVRQAIPKLRPVRLPGLTPDDMEPYDGEFGGAESLGMDNSAAMAEYGSDYEDPDLYPSGIDPVAELRERMKNHG